MSDLKELHRANRGVDFTTMLRIARIWADTHTEQTGHPVWLHARSFLDFHLQCMHCTEGWPVG